MKTFFEEPTIKSLRIVSEAVSDQEDGEGAGEGNMGVTGTPEGWE